MRRLLNIGRQRPAAVAALAERSFVSMRVLLELEWVLRAFCEFPARDISRVLRALARIEHITLENRDGFLVAVDAFDKDLDFADALQLARSSRAYALATFDQQLARRAKRLGLTPPAALLARGAFGADDGPAVAAEARSPGRLVAWSPGRLVAWSPGRQIARLRLRAGRLRGRNHGGYREPGEAGIEPHHRNGRRFTQAEAGHQPSQ